MAARTTPFGRAPGLLVAVALGALLLQGAGAGAGGSPPPTLRLDGKPFRPELAITPDERAVGLMNRRQAPRDGMLFVFARDTTGGFWMKNTRVPLTIAFFRADGKRVRKLSMTPCRRDPCPVYSPDRRYRFALELPAADRRAAATLGPLRELRRLTRAAS